MAFRFLRRLIKGGQAAENYSKEFTDVYELDSIDDFSSLLLSLKPKNGCITEWVNGKLIYWIVDSQDVTKRAPMASGKVQVETNCRMHLLESFDQLAPPWQLPAYNFHIASAISEESASQFYPGDDDLILNQDDTSYPFTNSAGVMLEGTASFATAQITFSYAIARSTFYEIQDWFWSLPGKINADYVTICGMNFPPRTIKLEAMNAEYEEVKTTGQVVDNVEQNGNTIDITWHPDAVTHHYYRVDATLNANPRTWNQYFLNVGTHVRRGGGSDGALAQLWSWRYVTQSGEYFGFGTYADYQNLYNGGTAYGGQPVTEAVALNYSGDNANGIGNGGRQIMSYRHGSLYEPISFSALAFPSAPPKKWNPN